MSHLENAKDLYAQIGQGKVLDVFEKYYADDVQIQEANGEIRSGKEAQRQAVLGWMDSIKEAHGGGVTSFSASEDGNIVCIECWFDNTFKDGNRMKMEEVAVQTWNDGKIVRERFYYNVPGM